MSMFHPADSETCARSAAQFKHDPKAWEPQANPFYYPKHTFLRPAGWYWYDETGWDRGPYVTQRQALRDLLAYCRYLEIGDGPTVWRRVRYELRRLWHDTRG